MNFFRFPLITITALLMGAGLLLGGCSQGQSSNEQTQGYVSQRNECPNGKEADETVSLTERAWQFYPSEFTVQQGDLVKVKMEVTDNGIGAGHGFAIEGFEEKVFLNGVTTDNPKTACFEADKPPGEYTFYCATQCSTDRRHTNMAGKLVIRSEGAGGPPEEDRDADRESAEADDGKEKDESLGQVEKWKRVELPKPVPAMSEDLIERGKTLYSGKLACFSCHGSSGTGDGPAAKNLTNTETGEPISPRNFQEPENYKWGTSREAIARTVLTGGKNPGSPMPPMKGTVKPDELWAVASYVRSLQQKP